MDVRLVVKKGPARTREVRLPAEESIIGRSRDCDVCIPSKEVSRRHCLLHHEDGKLFIEDLNSANGTYLNGELVSGRQRVNSGDQLKVGPLTFTVEMGVSRAAVQTIEFVPPNPATIGATTEWILDAEPAAAEIVDALPLDGLSDEGGAEDGLIEVLPDDDGPIPMEPELPTAMQRPAARPTAPAHPHQPKDEEPLDAIFDDSQPLVLPEGEDFRDLLNKMDH